MIYLLGIVFPVATLCLAAVVGVQMVGYVRMAFRLPPAGEQRRG